MALLVKSVQLKERLKTRLPEELLRLVPRAFDVVGGREKAVAIVEIPTELAGYERAIAEEIMSGNKRVKSVLVKLGPRKGEYRLREYLLAAGDRNTEVVHVESGCRLKLDPQKVYFSPREGTERLRIAEKVRPGETVMVFFAGAGPFAIIIGKKTKAEEVAGIEINPDAVRYFEENIRLNRLENVRAVPGDVAEKAKEFHGRCDRVIMPLPERALEFVDDAIRCIKPKGGFVHLYIFGKEEEIAQARRTIENAARKEGREVEILGHELVLPWGPRIWKMRIDFRVI